MNHRRTQSHDSATRCPRIGKTAKDRAKGHVPYRKNRRKYDKKTGETVYLNR